MSHLQKNLDALATSFPTLTAELARTQPPPDFLPTTALDGTPTFARTTTSPTKRIDYLGATSTPSAAANSIIKSLNPGHTNGLGLSIGTGHEWLAFTQKLSPRQTLFLFEPDLPTLLLALQVTDLSPLLASQKIILIAGPNAANDLSAFLQNNPGFDPPTVLHPLPTLTGERRNALLAAGEAIVRRVVAEYHATLSTLATKIPQPLPNTSISWLLSQRYALERPLHTLHPDNALHLENNSTASLLPRIQSLIDHRPSLIRSDAFRAQLETVPPEVPLETWIPPLAGPRTFLPESLAATGLLAHDRIIVHFAEHRSLLESAGVPASQIHLQPLTPPAAVGGSPSAPSSSPRTRIVLLADLPPFDPDSLGFTLPTQLAVYHAALSILEEDYLTAHPALTPDILRRSLARAGISQSPSSSDPAFTTPFLTAIRLILLPTIPLLTLIKNLHAAQIPLQLIGDFTPAFSPTSPLKLPANIPTTPFPQSPADLPPLFADCALLLHLPSTGPFSPLLLQAPTYHVTLISPQHPTDSLEGSLPTLAQLRSHPKPTQLLPTLKSLLP